MPIGHRHIEQASGDHLSLVNIDQVIEFLGGNPDERVVAQLYDFGKLLLDQIRALRDSHDAKLTSCLGWSVAILAVVLVAPKDWMQAGLVGNLTIAASISAALSTAVSGWALYVRGGWKWPSERDWFNDEYLRWPPALQKQHLIAMLEAHQCYASRTQAKGGYLHAAQLCLAASGLFFAVAAISKHGG